MVTDLDLGKFCPDHTNELVDQLVDYCIKTYGEREGAIRALAAVGVGAEQCTVALPHRAHLDDGCPGLSLAEWVAGGIEPLRAQKIIHRPHQLADGTRCIGRDSLCDGVQLAEPDGPDYDETAETADECRRDLTEAEQ